MIALAASPAGAQSNADGYVYGRSAAAGSAVTVTNIDTGLKREVKADAGGDFRVGSLPTGRYLVAAKAPSGAEESSEVITVSVGTGSAVRLAAGAAKPVEPGRILMQKFEVSAAPVSPIDVTSTESATILSAQTITQLPVARSLSAVALLAPGTSPGVAAFGSLVSFGGSSVAENAYFVNGFNVTSFRNGLSYAQVPFEFYDNFQVKTGGYSAEFGRSTGGVQNSTTKRGGNTLGAEVNVFWQPNELQDRSPSLYLPDGTLVVNRSQNKSDSVSANLSVSGPIIKNRLFFYGLYNARKAESEGAGLTTFSRSSSDDPFWGGKLDWNITDRHTLELTGFSDKRVTEAETLGYNFRTGAIGASLGVTEQNRGGDTYIARYSGVLTDNLTLSLLAGQGETQATDRGAGDSFAYILDARTSAIVQLGKATSAQPGMSEDRRKAYRADAEYTMGDHRFRVGFDREDTRLNDLTQYSGGVYWRYIRTTRASQVLPNGGVVAAAGTDVARKRIYQNGGAFQTLTTAIYAEDNWKLLNDRLMLNLGLRNEAFDNRNVYGKTFVKIADQLAPRLGASFDPDRNGKSKFFANYGRYHLPIAANTNLRLAGGELYYEEYYNMSGLTADSLPTLGSQIGGRNVFSDGSVKDPKQIVDANLKPMYQDEIIVGYQRALDKGWTVGLRGIWRNLKSSIEDVAIDETLNAYARANGIPATKFDAHGNDYYVLTNPGQPMRVTVDFNDGKGAREVSFSPAELKYPRSQRYYAAAEVFFEKVYDGKLFLQGSYTLSHSYGNNEGYVRSDNGQSDAGLTTLFDHPGLMDGAWGSLPNDHRHKFKAFGSYNFIPGLQLGSNFSLTSGMPINAFGFHPTDPYALQYGVASFYENGKLVPRGSRGRTPWIRTFDVTLRWTPKWLKGRTRFTLDIFNLFNFQDATEVTQDAEQTAQGTPNPRYRLPSSYQQARYMRLSASYRY